MRTVSIYKKRILSAVLAAAMLMLTACGRNKEKFVDYEKLKTDIIGIWCDVDGPEFISDGELSYYRMYEFTSDGKLIYHMPSDGSSIYFESTYVLRDDYMTVDDDAMCRITLEDDILTMINNNGSTPLRRMSMPEICSYQVVLIDGENHKAQAEYTEDYQVNWGEPYDPNAETFTEAAAG